MLVVLNKKVQAPKLLGNLIRLSSFIVCTDGAANWF